MTTQIEEQFKKFYLKLDGMLEEFGKAAEETRASVVTHLPSAVSVPALTEKVIRIYSIVFSVTHGAYF